MGNPFTETGESDASEARFPIEVWNGEQIGGIAPVTAGAWGTSDIGFELRPPTMTTAPRS
ncbi:MAG: hypothetical protein WCA57_04980 [Ilumatobacteraceae bacterium]